MKKFLIAATAVAAVAVTAVPASAQFWAGADPSGVGVQVGPLGVGVGPRFAPGPYTEGHYAYRTGECRTIRERVTTPSGRVIVKRTRVCD
jgi:hypothetical protein